MSLIVYMKALVVYHCDAYDRALLRLGQLGYLEGGTFLHLPTYDYPLTTNVVDACVVRTQIASTWTAWTHMTSLLKLDACVWGT